MRHAISMPLTGTRRDSKPGRRSVMASLLPLVDDRHQIKRLGRRGRTGGAPVASLEGSGQAVGGPAPFAHELQASHHIAHLVMKEGAGRGLDADLLADALDRESIQGLYGRGRLAD